MIHSYSTIDHNNGFKKVPLTREEALETLQNSNHITVGESLSEEVFVIRNTVLGTWDVYGVSYCCPSDALKAAEKINKENIATSI